MKKIALYFLLLTYSISILATSTVGDSINNDSAKIESTQTSIPTNNNSTRKDKIEIKMEQKNKEHLIAAVKKTIVLVGICLAGLVIIVLGVLTWLLYDKVYKKLTDVKRNCSNVENKTTEILKQVNKTLDNIEKMTTETAKKAEDSKNKITTDLKQNISTIAVQKEGIEPTEKTYNAVQKNKSQQTVYAKPLQDGRLKRTEEFEAIYIVTTERNAIKGKFSVYDKDEQKVIKAIKNKDVLLDKFCEARGSSTNAIGIKNINDGEVEQEGNGTWKIITKAEIEFIK